MPTITYKCPNCGGELMWSPDAQRFTCEYCSSEFTEEEAKQQSPQAPTAEDEQFDNETDVYICKSCGAEIFCDHNTAASFCYYCHNPVSLSGRLEGKYRPDMIIPFSLSRDKALELFKAHCRKKLFLPFNFLSDSTLEKMTGLYVPFWIADVNVDADITATSKEETSHSHGNKVTVTTRTYDLRRSARMFFRGIPADGSRKIDDDVMDAIEPFDYNDLRNFDMSYLSGFYADKYDVDKLEVLPRIQERVDKAVTDRLLYDMRGHGVPVIKEKRIRLTNTNWRYMLLPAWFMTYKYNGKVYTFALNGQTSKVAGRYPISPAKVFSMAAIIVAVITGIGILFGGVI
ncbi:MAG: hypothetical protein II936_07940 [Oscillospiraceae bacterium]|nr:hypothetical protein [Oscillospiraceae bacterium]